MVVKIKISATRYKRLRCIESVASILTIEVMLRRYSHVLVANVPSILCYVSCY